VLLLQVPICIPLRRASPPVSPPLFTPEHDAQWRAAQLSGVPALWRTLYAKRVPVSDGPTDSHVLSSYSFKARLIMTHRSQSTDTESVLQLLRNEDASFEVWWDTMVKWVGNGPAAQLHLTLSDDVICTSDPHAVLSDHARCTSDPLVFEPLSLHIQGWQQLAAYYVDRSLGFYRVPCSVGIPRARLIGVLPDQFLHWNGVVSTVWIDDLRSAGALLGQAALASMFALPTAERPNPSVELNVPRLERSAPCSLFADDPEMLHLAGELSDCMVLAFLLDDVDSVHPKNWFLVDHLEANFRLLLLDPGLSFSRGPLHADLSLLHPPRVIPAPSSFSASVLSASSSSSLSSVTSSSSTSSSTISSSSTSSSTSTTSSFSTTSAQDWHAQVLLRVFRASTVERLSLLATDPEHLYANISAHLATDPLSPLLERGVYLDDHRFEPNQHSFAEHLFLEGVVARLRLLLGHFSAESSCLIE